MLDAHIIDAIKRQQREKERRWEEGRRIRLEIPLWSPPARQQPDAEESDPTNGVVIPYEPEIPLR